MDRAWAILSKCMRPVETGLAKNEFIIWLDQLDWVDSRRSFATSKDWIWKFTQKQLADLKKDAFMWSVTFWHYRPWVWTKQMDIDPNDIYIVRDANDKVVLDDQWRALYKYHSTWEIVDWSKIWNKKESVLWLFMRDKKKMASAPSRYFAVKNSMYRYVPYLKVHHSNLMTEDWFDILENRIRWFFNDIENWKWKQHRYKTLTDLYTSELWNHRFLMSKIMPQEFDRMTSDKDVARQLLWYDFSTVTFREFSEAASVYANKERWWNLTVADAMWTKYADQIYWAKTRMLFDIDEEWKVSRSTEPKEWHISKTYLMQLSTDQQIEQIKFVLWADMPSMDQLSAWMKIKIWWYKWWWIILRWLNLIGSPSVYSALMTFWKWMTWFMPLLILNSWMFVTDAIAKWHRLDWDWKTFFKKWWLKDWLPESYDWYSSWIWNTLWDMSRTFYSKVSNIFQQWAFNAMDTIMENSYKVRQFQLFFESQFPWIRSVSELDSILESIKRNDDAMKKLDINYEPQLDRMLEAARWYSEYSIRLATTNTPVLASLVRVHAAKNPLNQPMLDCWYVMWNFFAWWWFNKISWAWKIFKDWMSNIYHWRIWSKYLDDLLASWVDEATVRANMTRAYLENEELIYFFHKIYTAMMIWKYLDRLSESWSDKDNETLFDDLSDMLRYLDIFSWDYAALTANPQWRLVKNFWDMFIWELENNASMWTALKAWTAAATKEAFRSFFRRLYWPQIATEYVALENADWDMKENTRVKKMVKSIQDNVNWYLFYLKDQTENWEYDYYIPRWPNSYVNSILWVTPKSIEFVNDQKMLSKLANLSWWLFEDNSPFHNWVIYSFPFLKQWNISQIAEVEWFIDDHNKFRSSKEYIDMTNWRIPWDMDDTDWEYMYKIVTRRLVNNEDKISNDSLLAQYSFVWEDWNVAYNKALQTQEYIVHKFMQDWLTEEQANELYVRMNKKTDRFDEEAIRTLAYMEAKTPGSSLQAVAYLMNKEWLDYVRHSWVYYNNTPESQALLQERMKQWEIEAAKKYSQYVPYIDRYYIWPQFILHYAKVHNTPLAKYIDWPWDKNSWAMKLVTPGSTVDDDWVVHQNSILIQNFQAQLMVDIEWANWNPDARKLMNWFSLIFDTKKYENVDWTLQPKYAAYALNQLETIYNHIDSLAIDETSKHILKQWTLMFWDKLYVNVINDSNLMKRDDVKQIVKDWAHYWYWEFRELDKIAIDAAEDQLSNKEWKSYWAKKNYLTSWLNKRFSWFVNWYDYMKNRAYSNNYMRYRVFDWTPRDYQRNYLSEYDFNQAKYAQWWRMPLEKKSTGKWWKSGDDWIWVTTRRWKSLQFYKREDPDKPVEYRLPRRKRRVRRWKWVKPISSTTWKHLTPKPKTNG